MIPSPYFAIDRHQFRPAILVKLSALEDMQKIGEVWQIITIVSNA